MRPSCRMPTRRMSRRLRAPLTWSRPGKCCTFRPSQPNINIRVEELNAFNRLVRIYRGFDELQLEMPLSETCKTRVYIKVNTFVHFLQFNGDLYQSAKLFGRPNFGILEINMGEFCRSPYMHLTNTKPPLLSLFTCMVSVANLENNGGEAGLPGSCRYVLDWACN